MEQRIEQGRDMPPPIPRRLYPRPHVDEVSPDTRIFRYFPIARFEDFVARSALYFRRIDHFDDTSDGTVPLALWSIEHPAIRQWYERCKEELFVNCWNLDEDELPHMWTTYAGNCGVRVASTVGRLADELSHPPVADPPIPPEYASLAARPGVVIHVGEPVPHDGFTVGRIRYMDFDAAQAYELMQEGVSNVVPAFRKRHGFAPENEFRAILCPGSQSSMDAQARGDISVYVPLRLERLIEEVRFFPAGDARHEQRVRDLLSSVATPVVPARLGSPAA
jgi:hypothetical protein